MCFGKKAKFVIVVMTFKNAFLMKYLYLFIVIVSVLFVSCKRNNNEVVVYTSVDQVFSEPVLKEFEKETGIKVKALYDTEEAKSTGVLNRIIAEKNNPRCDVFWSGDPVRVIVLKNRGLTQPYKSPEAKDISRVFKDSTYNWTGFSARARVIIYNKKLLNGGDVPTSIFDLTKEKYKGKVAIANPLFGTTTFHIAALFTVLGDEKATQYLNDLKRNEVIITTSNGDVKNKVLKGEAACGLTDTDDAFEAVKESNDVAYLFPDQDNGFGCLIMPNAVCLIKNSPHAGNGKKLIDFLLSRKTEKMLAVSCAQMPLHKGVEVPEDVPLLDDIIPVRVDYNKAAEKLEKIQNTLKEWVEQ